MAEEIRSDIRKTNLTLSRKDLREFKRLMLDWEDEYDFPIELKESHALNAAVKLIIRASSPELIDEYSKSKNYTEEEAKQVQEEYKWFMAQFLELLADTIQSRIETDKRRGSRFV